MNPTLVACIIVVYFGALIFISYLTSKNADSNTFFTANKQSPWFLVAFGMIGTSISGVTFISVPGNVGKIDFSYFQLILGNFVGYIIIATLLMPLYYRLKLVSIYTYLDQRLGFWSYKTGAFIFILSRTIGAALRLFLAAAVLQIAIFDAWGIPFFATVLITLVLIWLYTFKGGIKTIIYSDTFQTVFLVLAVIICVFLISNELNLTFSGLIKTVDESSYSQMFFWDYKDGKFFWKQFLAGIFICIAMTGLDQDLMQKNLTCKNIRDAQKNMFSFSIIFLVVNLLFQVLGALLYIYSDTKGIAIPENTDLLFPILALNNFGLVAGIFFLLGIIASSFASSDSALASLTTSFCIDFLNFDKREEKERQRLKFWVHIGFSFLLFLVIIIFKAINSTAVITAVLLMASFTYGPLLGLYTFGLFTKRMVIDKWVPLICIISPLLCFVLYYYSEQLFSGYKLSFEVLIINAIFTIIGLFIISKKPLGENQELQTAFS
ncbi:MAG TPA: sodium:solute symporter [Cytophagales bacterium]|nr:sodium:solute symporter [Cytophagales bacterium]